MQHSFGMRRAASGAPPTPDTSRTCFEPASMCANTHAGVLSENYDNKKLNLLAAPTKLGLLASFVPTLLLKELEKGANLQMPSSQQYEAVALFAVRPHHVPALHAPEPHPPSPSPHSALISARTFRASRS